MEKTPTFDEFLGKIEKLKENAGADLSTAEDLSIAVMNLISLEEHFYFTGEKTRNDEYFDMAGDIREVRKKLLQDLMPNHEGETWCISKHLLASTMRLIEVGNKLLSEGKRAEAHGMFDKAYRVYSIFWALKLKLITIKKGESKFNTKLEDLVTKLAECCDE
ncbi:hypothetical protein HYW53_00045 [Candidatus Giovannonibacteria bacterium]|nr:hypothetical protein [Candidatus Giovannonibacteria bacterium]